MTSSRARSRLGGRAARWAMLVALLVPMVAPSNPVARARAQAQAACVAEEETNNEPATANPIAGAVCVEAAIGEDGQDFYRWTVAGDEVGSRWTLSASGIADQVVRIVVYREEPASESLTQLVDVPTETLGTDARVEGLVFAAGDYLVAVTASGEGPYRLDIEAAGELPAGDDDEPNDDAGSAQPVEGAFAVGGDLAGSEDLFAWTLSDDDAASHWQVGVQTGVGEPLTLTLRDEAGTDLARVDGDALGRVVLAGLGLAAGTYAIGIGPAADGEARYGLEVAAGSPRTADTEDEPNDETARAFPFDPTAPVYGHISHPYDQDRYALTVDEALAGSTFDLTLMAGPGIGRKLCLEDAAETDLLCREGDSGLTALAGLVLPAGDYVVRVSGEMSMGDEYSLDLLVLGAVEPGVEAEPNDSVTVASGIDDGALVRGTVAGSDRDVFRLLVVGEPQLWRVEAVGSGLSSLRWEDINGTVLADGQITREGGRAELTDVFLTPGDHWFELQGEGGAYTLQATPLGPPEPGGEREANNDPIHAEPMLVGEARTGRIVDAVDTDYYRFSLAAREHVVVRLTSPADSQLQLRVADGVDEVARWESPAPGESFAYDGLLEPGDYVVTVLAAAGSTARYGLAIERADPFLLADDQEPNASGATARPMPAGRELSGRLDLSSDADWYALAASDVAGIELSLEGDGAQLHLSDGLTDYELQADEAGERLTPVDRLPEDVPLYVVVRGSGPYRLSLGDGGGSLLDLPIFGDGPEALAASATLEMAADEVGAYLELGQVVDGRLTLTSTADAPQTLTLSAVTSHYAWRVELDQTTVELGAGQTVVVPARVVVEADAWANVPVRVSVGASGPDGATISTFAEITPTALAEPVAPQPSWAIPAALLGGLDVAAASQGATLVDPLFPEDELQLHDGITPDGMGFLVEPPLPITTTVDLAGDGPIAVAGFVVNPQAGDATSSAPRRVELLLSSDGVTFEPVYDGELSPLPIEQSIVLGQPIEASHARLVVHTAHGPAPLAPRTVEIGEWKVVAQPGVVPDPSLGVDIAAGLVGGHVVLLEPQGSDDPNFPLALLDEEPTRWSMPVEAGARPSLVIGFHADRAAMITELRWVDPAGSLPETRLAEVAVEVSLASPLGPWEAIGVWELDRAGDGSVAPLVLGEARWARFVRMTGTLAVTETRDAEFPATIRVIEAAASGEYRSILGEWGANRPAGIYEQLNPPTGIVPDTDDAADTAEEARPLAAGEAVAGRAAIGIDVDWYAVTIPDGQNELALDVTGEPVVDVTVELFDAGQGVVPVELVEGESPGELRYVARVEPGATYTVRVAQPQHSIVFAFDTSGSIGPFYDAVFQSLRSYAREVAEGQEFVQIVAFDEEPLLDGWSDDPYLLSTAISRYAIGLGSSSAEAGVLSATELLRGQDGTKAILLITDAETSSYPSSDEMWRELGAVSPRIFAVHIGAVGTHNQSQDWMQDWAISGGGHYQYTRTQAEMDRAFDRAATWLRRPAGYGLSYATAQTSTEPGSLRVVARPVEEGSGEAPASTISDAVSVEIIYDTSGSMLAPMADGQRRVDVARAVLTDLVRNQIPAGVPVALRVFGDTVGSCETTLAMPLAPLDPEAMAGVIQAIEPVNEVKTPIGAALDQVASDLAGVDGPKIVVLVTDGEETCGGDAGAAIEALVARGVDVQVNIVGFALEDEALRSTFRRWARLGNGTYFDATDDGELQEAIRRAVQAPFRVYAADGELVASGTVDGSSVRLPAGTYRVVVLTDPETVYERVVIEPEGKLKLTLGEEPPG